jgi:hypothetical protein
MMARKAQRKKEGSDPMHATVSNKLAPPRAASNAYTAHMISRSFSRLSSGRQPGSIAHGLDPADPKNGHHL